jgi:hypothetical protein
MVLWNSRRPVLRGRAGATNRRQLTIERLEDGTVADANPLDPLATAGIVPSTGTTGPAEVRIIVPPPPLPPAPSLGDELGPNSGTAIRHAFFSVVDRTRAATPPPPLAHGGAGDDTPLGGMAQDPAGEPTSLCSQFLWTDNLIAALGHEEPGVREEATNLLKWLYLMSYIQLVNVGPEDPVYQYVEPRLRKAAESPDAEVRYRALDIIESVRRAVDRAQEF